MLPVKICIAVVQLPSDIVKKLANQSSDEKRYISPSKVKIYRPIIIWLRASSIRVVKLAYFNAHLLQHCNKKVAA